jgi:hypothetical protein
MPVIPRAITVFTPALTADPICQLKVLMHTKNIGFEELAYRSGYKTKYVKKLFKGAESITVRQLVTFSLLLGATCSISITETSSSTEL